MKAVIVQRHVWMMHNCSRVLFFITKNRWIHFTEYIKTSPKFMIVDNNSLWNCHHIHNSGSQLLQTKHSELSISWDITFKFTQGHAYCNLQIALALFNDTTFYKSSTSMLYHFRYYYLFMEMELILLEMTLNRECPLLKWLPKSLKVISNVAFQQITQLLINISWQLCSHHALFPRQQESGQKVPFFVSHQSKDVLRVTRSYYSQII